MMAPPRKSFSREIRGDEVESGARPNRFPPNPNDVKINVEGAFIVDDEFRPADSNDGAADEGVHYENKDIRLPHHTGVVSHVAVDVGAVSFLYSFLLEPTLISTSNFLADLFLCQIGGSLAKLVYFSREPDSADNGGRLNFLNFETDRIDLCIDFLHQLQVKQSELNGSTPAQLKIMATGGGAYKFYDRIKDFLGVEIIQEDEMECLIIGTPYLLHFLVLLEVPWARSELTSVVPTGLDFFITEIPQEVFSYSEEEPMQFAAPHADIYPYLLVNIGSGVSMVKVSGPRRYERVGGTSLGGGTFWGILSLLTGARTFDEMLKMAEAGDNSGVDMLVGDIYGTGYGKIGLKSSTIASTFGKVFRLKRVAERDAEDGGGFGRAGSGPDDDGDPRSFRIEDMSRSLLYAISNNIGQIAYLQSEKHRLPNIYFGGSFIRGYTQTMNTLSYAIKYWSNGEKRAYFLRHEGYLGSVGAFLKTQPKNWGRRNSLDDGVISRIVSRQEDTSSH